MSWVNDECLDLIEHLHCIGFGFLITGVFRAYLNLCVTVIYIYFRVKLPLPYSKAINIHR